VAIRPDGAHRHDPGANAAEVHHVFALEADVGFPEFSPLQQLADEG